MAASIDCPFISKETQNKIQQYIEWSPISKVEKVEVEKLLKNVSSVEHAKSVEDRFLNRLQFGTSGLRGKMGCGFNCMNDLIVIQTTQGIASYLLKRYGVSKCEKNGVIIGYDGRYCSERYAHVVAASFLAKNFKVYLNSSVVATPLIPFGILKYGCLCGIQITASHNPKDDNGYKVYGENGAQIIPPVDSDVSLSIVENLKPWDETLKYLDTTGYIKKIDELYKQKKLTDPYTELVESYMTAMTQELCHHHADTAATNLSFVYSPLHGVGYSFTSELVKRFGLKESNFHVVNPQKLPDPDFPTLAFPNPEEKGALDYSIALANEVNAPLILANDPDADRFACAEKQKDGTWKTFSGDQLGLLFASWALNIKRSQTKKKLVCVCSAVSSRMLKKFSETTGCEYAETATGFKWIMNKALELCKGNPNNEFCFAYEEALGYALSLQVPDKDGISACAVFTEMACQIYKQGLTISEQLDQLYCKYGYSATNNSYFFVKDPKVVTQIFFSARNDGNYCRKFGAYLVNRIRDVTMRYDDGETDCECKLPFTPNSEMITFYFSNGVVLTCRTSGTEPKLKWYSELIGENLNQCKHELDQTVNAWITHFIQYEKFKDQLKPATFST